VYQSEKFQSVRTASIMSLIARILRCADGASRSINQKCFI